MWEEQALVAILEKEKAVLKALIETTLKERDGIIYFNYTILSDCRAKKEELQERLISLEEERSSITGEKTLPDMVMTANQAFGEKLSTLRWDLKAATREAQALGKANALLFKQSLAYARSLQQEISPGKSSPYNRQGMTRVTNSEGNLISSSA